MSITHTATYYTCSHCATFHFTDTAVGGFHRMFQQGKERVLTFVEEDETSEEEGKGRAA